jgi:DNA-directed RNA polymerase subunit beta
LKEKLPVMQGSRFMLKETGVVEYVDANEIHVRYKGNEMQQLVSFEDDLTIYKITKFVSYQPGNLYQPASCGNQGQKVSEGDFLTEGYATKGGELALGT